MVEMDQRIGEQEQTEYRSAYSLASSTNTSDEKPVHQVFRILFHMAHYAGLNIPVKDKSGTYILRWYGMIPIFICSGISLYSLVICIYSAIAEQWPYWYIIMTLPTFFTFCFCLRSYGQVFVTASQMVVYMENTKQLTIKRTWYTQYLILVTIAYPVTLSLCTLALVPEIKTLPNLLPILLASFVPTVFDIFTCVFVVAIQKAFRRLADDITKKESWTTEEIQETYNVWLRLSHLLKAHNRIPDCSQNT
ncbi:hypothetical protein SK128_005507 [Halocaridina rubra]|uniref:Uncharacterized protein n=1 Tax=Halocaridina rubra TaxID=373956 RepID=A0AAN8WFE1_HALRR